METETFEHMCWGHPCDGEGEHDSGSGVSQREHPGVPVAQTDKGGKIDRIAAAEKMYGTGSKQHIAAIKKYGGKSKVSAAIVNATGPIENALRLKAKAELAEKVNGLGLGLTAAGVHNVGDVVSSEGWCTLPSGNTVHLEHSICVKRGGTWSPAQNIGYVGRGVGEESAAHESGETPTQESVEEGSSASAPSGPAAPSGGGSGGAA